MARSASGTTDRAPFRSARLNGDQHGDRAPVLQLPTPFDLRLGTANPRVVDLHVAVERLPRRIDHRSPQFVEEHPGGFIPAQPELALQQERRDAALIGRHQIRGPEPVGQRGLRVVQDGSRRQRYLMPAFGTLPAALRHGVRTPASTAGAGETLRPATRRQMLAGVFGRELPLKLAQILRTRRARHAPTLQIGAC
jgi:hypothetical protein